MVFIDTFHLFPETHAFLARCEAAYSFKAHTFHAAGLADRAAYDAQMGAEFWREDIDAYDKLCKVEPFARALSTLAVDCMVNGRRRDHGAERAGLMGWETGSPAKCQPLAWWEFADCFAYLERHGVEAHPLHAAGYPSIGDVHSTLPVPRAAWFAYAGERSGRFQGLVSKDGKPKTECGIHSDGAERAFERDLWPAGGSAVTQLDAAAWASAGASAPLPPPLGGAADALLIIYAPWCPFCQRMEAAAEELAAAAPGGLRVCSLRGDLHRDFVRDALQVSSFPTVLAVRAGATSPTQAVKHASEARSPRDLLDFVNRICGSTRQL